MRKYNMNNECNGNTYSNRWGNRAAPYFDIPCLYYPQYPCNWNHSNCQKDYAVFGITNTNGNENLVDYRTQIIDGRSIHLEPDNETIVLQPGKLYQVNYQLTALINNDMTLIPIIDAISDLCSAATVTGPGGINSTQTLSGSLLLPVVDTPSTLQFQLQSSSTAPEQPHGAVAITALAELYPCS